MPELVTIWIILAIGAVAAWCIIRASYLRGFSDGRAEERERVAAAEPLTDAEAGGWIRHNIYDDPPLPIAIATPLPGSPYKIENHRYSGRCPVCWQYHGSSVATTQPDGTVPHG